MKKTLLMTGAATLALVLAVTAPWRVWAQEVQEVLVQNFPELQKVEGEVKVNGTIHHSRFEQRETIVVTPARRSETTDLTPAGVIATDGFTRVVLSLNGAVRDNAFEAGTVGAVLVPDEAPVLEALREHGRLDFGIEVVASVDPKKGGRFSSEPTQLPIAFPRYRVFLYNSSNKSVEANLYAYVTN